MPWGNSPVENRAGVRRSGLSLGRHLCLLAACAIFVGCSHQQASTREHPEVWEALHQFYWMLDDGQGGEQFGGKPFLQQNADGTTGAAGVLDVDRDGTKEFLLAIYHVPRGIPSVEVFEVQGDRLRSTGGFFGGNEAAPLLSYYRDEQQRLFLVQETESHYSGIRKTLVVTDVEQWQTVPVGSEVWDYSGDEEQATYYLYPENGDMECTNFFLCTGTWEGQEQGPGVEVTKEEYERKTAEFIDSLTWVEDVPFAYSAYYHLYNGADLGTEIRYDEIAAARENFPEKSYQTQEELQKTSEMVADALYGDFAKN